MSLWSLSLQALPGGVMSHSGVVWVAKVVPSVMGLDYMAGADTKDLLDR